MRQETVELGPSGGLRATGWGWGEVGEEVGGAAPPYIRTAVLGGAAEALNSGEARPWGPAWDCGYPARLAAPGLHSSARPAPGAP